ncbi:MAG TPA: hypothetical protein VFH87_03255, partial [Candidatus Udaeobacter sp.]|nr:hypothetical protein [Candidatus Udaeobacter sp.]
HSVRSYDLLVGCVGRNAENVVMTLHPAVVRDCIAVHARRQDHACCVAGVWKAKQPSTFELGCLLILVSAVD